MKKHRLTLLVLGIICFLLAPRLFPSNQRVLPFPEFELSKAHNPFSFIVYGDVQDVYDNGHRKLVDQMAKQNVSMIFNTGDISPNHGENLDGQFHADILNLAGQVPFFPAIGNHDVKFHSPQSRISFLNYFQNVYDYLSGQPLNLHLARREDNQRLWYAFRYATSLFLVLDSNLIIDSGRYKETHSLPPYRGLVEEQFRWAQEVLEKSEQDSNIKSRFVLMHHSPFLSKENTSLFGMGGHENDRELMVLHGMTSSDGNGKQYLLDLFRKHNVTSVFSGHEHYYERWLETIHESDASNRNINWIVVGSGGVKPRDNLDYGDKDLMDLFEPGELYDQYLDRIAKIDPAWSAKLERVFPNKQDSSGSFQNYMLVHVDGTEVQFQTIDVSGKMRDSGYFSR